MDQIHIPSLELLESAHMFPTEYIFKVIAYSQEGFLTKVAENITQVQLSLAETTISHRYSAGNRHIAITIMAKVSSALEIQKVYYSLQNLEGLIVLL